MHRFQYLYNNSTTQGLYRAFREGGAIFCTENINGELNRYVTQSKFLLRDPHTHSLSSNDLVQAYAWCLLWKYLAEQHGVRTGTSLSSTPMQRFDVYRLILEETAAAYSIENLRNARERMAGYGTWDSFNYSGNELASHETSWGNYVLANYLHGTADPVSDSRFDYHDDEQVVKWFAGLGTTLSMLPTGFRHDGMLGQGVEAEIPSTLLEPWSSSYFRIRPDPLSPPRVLRVDFEAGPGFDSSLVQIATLGSAMCLTDVSRSVLDVYAKTINMANVEEIGIIVTSRRSGV